MDVDLLNAKNGKKIDKNVKNFLYKGYGPHVEPEI